MEASIDPAELQVGYTEDNRIALQVGDEVVSFDWEQGLHIAQQLVLQCQLAAVRLGNPQYDTELAVQKAEGLRKAIFRRQVNDLRKEAHA